MDAIKTKITDLKNALAEISDSSHIRPFNKMLLTLQTQGMWGLILHLQVIVLFNQNPENNDPKSATAAAEDATAANKSNNT